MGEIAGGKLEDEIVWIRAMLTEWGIWRHMTHNLPAYARLRTGGDDIVSTSESLELTHRAVMHLKGRCPMHYKLIQWLYEPEDGWCLSVKEIVDDEAKMKHLCVGSKTKLLDMRKWAELKIASFRQGMSEVQDDAVQNSALHIDIWSDLIYHQ